MQKIMMMILLLLKQGIGNKMDQINNLRNKVDVIDNEIMQLLKKRLLLSLEFSKYKKKNGIKIRDKKRETEMIEDRLKKTSLDPYFIKKLFKLILKESRRLQKINFKLN